MAAPIQRTAACCALISALILGAPAAALAATEDTSSPAALTAEPSPTADEEEGEDTQEPTDPTPDPGPADEPTTSPLPEDDEDDDATEPTEEPSPEPAPLNIQCSNSSVPPGASVSVFISAPPGTSLALGSTSSQLGGSISLSGNEVTYTAPSSYVGTGQDFFTVEGTDSQGQRATCQILFTVYGETPSPTPPASPDPDQGATSPPQSPELTPTPGTTPPATEQPATEQPGTAAPAEPPIVDGQPTAVPPSVPGAPSPSQGPERPSILLPVPGIPMLPWLPGAGVEPTASATPGETPESELAESDTDSEDEGDDLALTGMDAQAAAALTIVALLIIGLGVGSLTLSRRLHG